MQTNTRQKNYDNQLSASTVSADSRVPLIMRQKSAATSAGSDGPLVDTIHSGQDMAASESPHSSFASQLCVMLHRNLLLKKKNPKLTVGEILLPLYFLGMFALMGYLMDMRTIAVLPAVPRFAEEPFKFQLVNFLDLAYAPRNPKTVQLMEHAKQYVAGSDVMVTLYPFESPGDLLNAYMKFDNNSSVTLPAETVAVVFEDPELKNLDYVIRFSSGAMPDTNPPLILKNSECRPIGYNASISFGPAIPNACRTNDYSNKGFTALQTLISVAYMKMKLNLSNADLPLPKLSAVMMPEPEVRDYDMGEAVMRALPASQILNILGLYAVFLVVYVVTEREKKYIENMKIMGLRPTVYWLSWVLLYGLLVAVVSALTIVMAAYFSVWPRSNVVMMFLACTALGFSLIEIALCLAPFFRKPLTAAMVVYIVQWILSTVSMAEDWAPHAPDYTKFLLALLPPSAFYMGFSRIARSEAFDEGIGFTNAFKQDGFSCAHAFGMLGLDVLIYGLLAVYIGKVTKNGDTPAESKLFFLRPSYWLSSRKVFLNSCANMEELFNSGDVEKATNHVRNKRAVVLKDLTKIFPGKKKVFAVNNFTFEMYEGEILAILGHNGAGKSTMMNMITGMLQPTSGSATVYGRDMSSTGDMVDARKLIGYCPQHNLLFDDFTVAEHLVFFARLKGYSMKEASEECSRIMDEVDIREQTSVLAKNLSGGQKRRLSIAIAVIGKPKVLILDEPSSGVDVYNQRFLWDLIRGFRNDRCIIVATQSMQEADVLADRKLIMSGGKLRCAGTSLFLKNRFGSGYYLTLTMDKDCVEASVDNLIYSLIGDAEKTRSHAGELCYILPRADMGLYADLFEKLEANKRELKIGSFGISLTTLEEIFLRLAAESSENQTDLKKHNSVVPRSREMIATDCSRIYPTRKGTVPVLRKFWALCKVRLLLMCRSAYALVYQFVIPIFSMLTLGGIALAMKTLLSGPPVEGSLSGEKIGEVLTNSYSGLFVDNKTGVGIEKVLSKLGQMPQLKYEELVSAQNLAGGFLMTDVDTSGMVRQAAIAYNSSARHVLPYLTNRLLSAMFQTMSGTDEQFRFRSYPLPRLDKLPLPPFDVKLIGPTLIGLALALIPSVFGMDVCRDRLIKTRSQIRMTGCSFWLYWTSSLAVHFVQYWVSFGIMVGILYAFGVSAVTDVIGYFVLIFACHSVASIVFSYCASFMFSKMMSATIGLPFVITQVAYVMYMAVFLLGLFSHQKTADHLHSVFSCLFPPYGIFGGLNYLFNPSRATKPGETVDYLSWKNNISVVLVANVAHIFLYTLLLGALEARFFNQSFFQFLGFPILGKKSTVVVQCRTSGDDGDVQDEANKVAGIQPKIDDKHSVLMRGLRKEFPLDSSISCRRRKNKAPKVAVQSVTAGIMKGEIFGLLGPNGAGKTTTLSMVSGEITPTQGDVHINGYNMHVEMQKAIEAMGNCPQIDTLWDDLTMSEHLELFTVLSDLHSERRDEDIKWFTTGLAITDHMPKKAAALSGGTKRKLTFIISMIGNRPVVMLDEPSTGMDPQSKRHLWDMVMASFCGPRGAILTTHSMEEADALCDRIGILVQGEMKCIGSSQHLKNKFGSGYILEIKLSVPGDVEQQELRVMSQGVQQKVKALFPSCKLEEDFYGRLVFAVDNSSVTSLGMVMRKLEAMKRDLRFEEYSFSQSTIEQVFLHFAKMQDAPPQPITVVTC